MSNARPTGKAEADTTPVDPELLPLAEYTQQVPRGGSNSQFAYEAILGALLNRVLSPGQRLAELPVSRALKIGRTPVREALLRLEAEGYLRLEPHAGMVVAGNSMESFSELYEIREVLESLAARLAARYARSEDILTLEQILTEAAAATEARDTARLRKLNTRFHEVIHACSRNNHLRHLLRQIINQLRLSPISTYDAPGRAEAALAEHRAIVAAIAANDEERAAALVSEHVRHDKEARLAQLVAAELAR